jgi:hypothetical protein
MRAKRAEVKLKEEKVKIQKPRPDRLGFFSLYNKNYQDNHEQKQIRESFTGRNGNE